MSVHTLLTLEDLLESSLAPWTALGHLQNVRSLARQFPDEWLPFAKTEKGERLEVIFSQKKFGYRMLRSSQPKEEKTEGLTKKCEEWGLWDAVHQQWLHVPYNNGFHPRTFCSQNEAADFIKDATAAGYDDFVPRRISDLRAPALPPPVRPAKKSELWGLFRNQDNSWLPIASGHGFVPRVFTSIEEAKDFALRAPPGVFLNGHVPRKILNPDTRLSIAGHEKWSLWDVKEKKWAKREPPLGDPSLGTYFLFDTMAEGEGFLREQGPQFGGLVVIQMRVDEVPFAEDLKKDTWGLWHKKDGWAPIPCENPLKDFWRFDTFKEAEALKRDNGNTYSGYVVKKWDR